MMTGPRFDLFLLPPRRDRVTDVIAAGYVAWLAALAVLAILATAAGCGGHGEGGDVASLITGEELQSRLGTPDAPVVLDVRTTGEFASGHIAGALHIPHTQVSRRLKQLEPYREREIVVYCTRGPRAYSAEADLRRAGFAKVRHLQGDITGWRRDGRPVVR